MSLPHIYLLLLYVTSTLIYYLFYVFFFFIFPFFFVFFFFLIFVFFFFFFFFSSRRRHTRLQGDWSSDVCSSDLPSSLPSRHGRDAVRRGSLRPRSRQSAPGPTRPRARGARLRAPGGDPCGRRRAPPRGLAGKPRAARRARSALPDAHPFRAQRTGAACAPRPVLRLPRAARAHRLRQARLEEVRGSRGARRRLPLFRALIRRRRLGRHPAAARHAHRFPSFPRDRAQLVRR